MDTDKSIDQILLEEFPAPTWEEWLKAAEDTLKGADFSKVMKTKTYEGITLNPIYRKEDMEKLSFLLSEPGIAPYLRGNDPAKRLRESWLIAQAQEEEDLGKLNEVILDELSRGLSAVNLSLKTADRKQGIDDHDEGEGLQEVDHEVP
ncbi:MAG: methylmalonyl-CoA mutase family protein, partial [Candidatus Cloacimonadota bacterium]